MRPPLRRALARIAFAGLGLAGFVAARMIPSVVATRSGLIWLAIGICIATGIAAWGIALLPPSQWSRLSRWFGRQMRPLPPPIGLAGTGITLTIGGTLLYLFQLGILFPLNDSYVGQDEHAYLITAADIHGNGGTLPFIHSLLEGSFEESNRHPLYLWLLSFWPTFTGGKLLSAAIGTATLGGVILLNQRIHSWLHTGVLTLLLSLNFAFTRFSVIIGSEILLVGFVAMLWLWLQHWFSRSDVVSDATPIPPLVRLALVSGVSMAFCWLAKGTGLLLTAGMFLWLCLLALSYGQSEAANRERRRLRAALRRVAIVGCCFVIAWGVVASPLLIRNVVRFSHPFYNVNSWLMFVDEYSDPQELARQQTTGEAAAAYLATHTSADIARREVSGIFWETFILIRMLGPPPLDDARILPGALIALLAVLGGIVRRDRLRWLLVWWLLVCMPMFAWYVPIAAGERFVLPLLIPILSLAADGILQLIGLYQDRGLRAASN